MSGSNVYHCAKKSVSLHFRTSKNCDISLRQSEPGVKEMLCKELSR